MVVPGVKLLIVPVQVGYAVGLSLIAQSGAQLPSCGTLPTTYTDWPGLVVPLVQVKFAETSVWPSVKTNVLALVTLRLADLATIRLPPALYQPLLAASKAALLAYCVSALAFSVTAEAWMFSATSSTTLARLLGAPV